MEETNCFVDKGENVCIGNVKNWIKTDVGAEWKNEEAVWDNRKNGDRVQVWFPYSFEWGKKVNKVWFIPNFKELGDIHRAKTIFTGTKIQALKFAKDYMEKNN